MKEQINNKYMCIYIYTGKAERHETTDERKRKVPPAQIDGGKYDLAPRMAARSALGGRRTSMVNKTTDIYIYIYILMYMYVCIYIYIYYFTYSAQRSERRASISATV